MTPQEFIYFIQDHPEGTKLPGDPVVRGDVELSGECLTWLPDNLIVTGNLRIRHCPNLKRLPAHLFVGGHLIITGSDIKAIPADLCVRGDIRADNLHLDIPASFTANGDLSLKGKPVLPNAYQPPVDLGDDLTVNGVLDLTNRRIKRWPKKLSIVKGRLLLGNPAGGGQGPGGITDISGTFTINGGDCDEI